MPKEKKTKKRTKPSPAKAKRPNAAPRAHLGAGAGADALPPAPLVRLTEADTKRRLKIIIGSQSGEDPDTITDGSPVLRAGILRFRLRSALNRHFFPPGLNGIDLSDDETVEDLASRIKRTRDPQLP
jgi:hypothetical protein